MSILSTEKRRIQRVVNEQGDTNVVHAETSADVVVVDANAIFGENSSVTNVQEALKKVADMAKDGGVTSVNGETGAVTIDKTKVGLGNVDNTADVDKPVSTAQQQALDKKEDKTNLKALAYKDSLGKEDVGLGNVDNVKQIPASEKGANGGVATLGADGKVPTSQLPSFVDDVLEYASKIYFPVTGETGKIYVANDTNITYRWGGTSYVEISSSLALGETSSTAYAGDKGKQNAENIATLQTAVNTTIPSTYQAKTDNTLETTAKTVVGAINEVKGTADGNATAISNIINGTTKVKKAETADNLSAIKTFALTGDVTGTVTSDLSSGVSIATTIGASTVGTTELADNAVTNDKILNGTIQSGKLVDVVTASAVAKTAVTFNSKGQITGAGNAIEFGATENNVPSSNLVIGGLFFELVE